MDESQFDALLDAFEALKQEVQQMTKTFGALVRSIRESEDLDFEMSDIDE